MPDDPIDPTAPDATGQMGSPAVPDQNLGAGANTAPTLGPQGYQGPRPILMDLIQGLISPKMQAPGPGQMARPVSRAATFEDFLGNFIGALGQGFAASGHGPGAFARGFGGAVGAPLQMQQQQQKFASEQAQQQAQTAQTQAQTQQLGNIVQTPYGPMSQALASKVFPAAIAGQSRVEAAGVGGQARVEAAGISGQSRVTAARIAQGMEVDVPQELQDEFKVPAKLPIAQLNKLEAAANRPLTTIQGATDQYQLNRLTGKKTALGVGNPRVAATLARPVQVADPNTPGGVMYTSAGQAMQQGAQAPSSSAVTIPKSAIRDFTSGKSAQTLNAFNTATEHLKLLSSLGDALQNGSTPLINRFGNAYATATGGAAPTSFNMAKNAVAGEIAKTFKGNATEGEISAINATIDNAQSPAQLKGAIQTALQLMGSKKQALQEQYTQALRSQPAFGGAAASPKKGPATDPLGIR